MTGPGLPETGHFSTAGPPDYLAIFDKLAKAEAECNRLRAALRTILDSTYSVDSDGVPLSDFIRAALGEADDE